MSEPRWSDGIPDANLRCMIVNSRMIAARTYKRGTNSALVSAVFGVGSTHATELCKRAGIDPDSTARADVRRNP